MTLPLDQVTLNKLVFIKQLFNHGIALSTVPRSPFRRTLAIISFDLSVETYLRVIIQSIDKSASIDDLNFHNLIKTANIKLISLSLPELPNPSSIKHAHNIRNDAQHNGRFPSEIEMIECRTYTSSLFTSTINSIWGTSFEDLHISLIVQNARVKQLLSSAESAFASGDYENAIKNANAALTWAITQIRDLFVGKRPRPESTGILISLPGEYMPKDMIDFISKGNVQMDEDLLMSFIRMQQTLLHLAFGIDAATYITLRQIAGVVVFDANNQPKYFQNKQKPTQEDAEVVLSICKESILQIESMFGDVQSPSYINPII
jgi:hypothetical protein